jgi:hypothetical protein
MQEVEERAHAVLAAVPDWIWDGSSLPVPVEDIADTCFGLLVREAEDLRAAPGAADLAADQALSGLLLHGRREIWVNAAEAREWPARRRFTIGHELGHWCLHGSTRGSIYCRHASVEPEIDTPDEQPPLPDIEREANAFGAALLMPAELVRKHYVETGKDHGALCELFGASGAAMGRRLQAVI